MFLHRLRFRWQTFYYANKARIRYHPKVCILPILRPNCQFRPSRQYFQFYYTFSFNFLDDSDDRIVNTLRLLYFIKKVLIPNGARIHDLIGQGPCFDTFSDYLPDLPRKGVKSSDRKGCAFTPLKKQNE